MILKGYAYKSRIKGGNTISNETNKTNEIKILDSIMGSGKSTYVKQAINKDYEKGESENKYIFITPYLKQIEDKDEESKELIGGIIFECPNAKFKQPKNLGDGKLDNLHNLIINNENIATTHMLFKHATNETFELLKVNEYIIVIDEAIDLFHTVGLSLPDYEMLIKDGKIKINEYNEVVWIDKKYNGTFDYLKEKCENGIVIESIRKNSKKKDEVIQLLVWNFNPLIFKEYTNSIYVLTYLFEGSYMYLYFKTHNIQYKKHTIINHDIVEYTKEIKQDKSHIKKLINLYEGKLNNVGDEDYSISKSWFFKKDNNNKEKNKLLIKQLQKNIYNYFRNIHKAKSDEIIWTTFKDCKSKLKGKGYAKSFLQCSEKGSNEYGDKQYIAYCCNRFFNPDDITYFNKYNVEVNNDLWALSEMIQFIWRSAIRNNKEIYLYIPSKRMRKLFKTWLNS